MTNHNVFGTGSGTDIENTRPRTELPNAYAGNGRESFRPQLQRHRTEIKETSECDTYERMRFALGVQLRKRYALYPHLTLSDNSSVDGWPLYHVCVVTTPDYSVYCGSEV